MDMQLAPVTIGMVLQLVVDQLSNPDFFTDFV